MTAKELANLTRVLPQVQKLTVIEERMFEASNECMDLFKKTGSFQALDKSVRTSYVVMRAIRDNIRYHADNIPSTEL